MRSCGGRAPRSSLFAKGQGPLGPQQHEAQQHEKQCRLAEYERLLLEGDSFLAEPVVPPLEPTTLKRDAPDSPSAERPSKRAFSDPYVVD